MIWYYTIKATHKGEDMNIVRLNNIVASLDFFFCLSFIVLYTARDILGSLASSFKAHSLPTRVFLLTVSTVYPIFS